MAGKRRSRWLLWIGLPVGGLVIAALGFALGWGRRLPMRLASLEWRQTLAAESRQLNDCAECHEAVDYHTCSACHDDHGALEFADLPFYALLALAGDVPQPGYVQVHQLLPYQDQPETRARLTDFLKDQGVLSFESVTLVSSDGGFVTLERQQLSDRAWLLPYEDGIRFACEDLHVSSWLKGITKLIVVAPEKPLLIEGVPTSMGRLLLGPTVVHTLEQTQVSLQSESDGVIRKASVASRLEGIALRALLDFGNLTAVRVRTKAGEVLILDAAAASGAYLTQFRGLTTLVLPERGRSEWIADLVSIESVE